VVLAAREKFERDGYRPTTIAAIAAQAGVSAESVYKGFGTKAALAKAVFDLALAGDDEPVPVAERPSMQAMRDETRIACRSSSMLRITTHPSSRGRPKPQPSKATTSRGPLASIRQPPPPPLRHGWRS